MEMISILDAMHYLQRAWNNVIETTIANCYKKAGFKVSDDTDAVDIETDIDEDPLDDLPPVRLLGANFTMSDYVGADGNVPTCEELTDDAIVDDSSPLEMPHPTITITTMMLTISKFLRLNHQQLIWL